MRHWMIITTLSFAACGVGLEPPADPGAPADPAHPGAEDAVTAPQGAGWVRLLLTDAPIDMDAVHVTFGEIRLRAENGGWTTVPTATQDLELLSLQNGVTAELGLTSVSTGAYDQIRLVLESADVVVAGVTHPLEVPSGDKSGLKILYRFEVGGSSETAVTLDFDAKASVHVTGNGRYIMRPVIKVIGTSSVAVDPEMGPVGEGSDAGSSDAGSSDAGTGGV